MSQAEEVVVVVVVVVVAAQVQLQFSQDLQVYHYLVYQNLGQEEYQQCAYASHEHQH